MSIDVNLLPFPSVENRTNALAPTEKHRSASRIRRRSGRVDPCRIVDIVSSGNPPYGVVMGGDEDLNSKQGDCGACRARAPEAPPAATARDRIRHPSSWLADTDGTSLCQ